MKKLMALLAVAALFCCNVNAQTPVLNIEGGQVQGVTTDINGVLSIAVFLMLLLLSMNSAGRLLSLLFLGRE